MVENKTAKNVVMICTASRGGMRAVAEGYREDGLFARWNVVLLNPHVEGSLMLRLAVALRCYLKFIGLLIVGKVGLVHCHAAMRGSFWRKSAFALSARLAGVPVIFHLHGSEMKPFVDSQPAWRQRLIRWILEKQSVVLVLSESWKAYVNTIATHANIVVMPNYVRLPDLKPELPEATTSIVKVLFLGLIGDRKGVYDLLPAFKTAREQIPELRLVIGGIGEVDNAQQIAHDLELGDSVDFAGWVSGDSKVQHLSAAQIYVLPSYNEGLPVSLLEAMSWQVPVISTKVGGIPELVRDQEDGILIEAGDQEALSKSLVRLARDAALRQEMGRSARRRVENHYAMQAVLPRIEELYHSLLEQNDGLTPGVKANLLE